MRTNIAIIVIRMIIIMIAIDAIAAVVVLLHLYCY